MMAAYEGKTVKQWLMDLRRVRLAEMEMQGILPKGKGSFFWVMDEPFKTYLRPNT